MTPRLVEGSLPRNLEFCTQCSIIVGTFQLDSLAKLIFTSIFCIENMHGKAKFGAGKYLRFVFPFERDNKRISALPQHLKGAKVHYWVLPRDIVLFMRSLIPTP